MGRGGMKLIVSDFIISFMWVWSSVLFKIYVYKPLGILGHNETKHEVARSVFSIINMFFFALLGKITHGGSYNPLMVLSTAISGDFETFLYTVGARIPAQVYVCLFVTWGLVCWLLVMLIMLFMNICWFVDCCFLSKFKGAMPLNFGVSLYVCFGVGVGGMGNGYKIYAFVFLRRL